MGPVRILTVLVKRSLPGAVVFAKAIQQEVVSLVDAQALEDLENKINRNDSQMI